MSNDSKIIMKIYRINTSISVVVDALKSRHYREASCGSDRYRLFVAAIDTEPKWGPFLNEFAKEQRRFRNVTESFVLIRIVGQSDAYAVTGGLGTYAIQPFIDPDFGLDVLSRLVKPDKIKAIRQQAISGNILQEELVYKRTHTYHTDPLGWLKLPREILGEIEKTDFSSELGLERKDRRPIRIESRRSFSIRRSLSFEELDKLLDRLDTIKHRPRKLELIKGCEEVPPSQRKKLNEALAQHISTLYQRYLRDPKEFTDSSVYLASDDALQWLLCIRFQVSLGPRTYETNQMELNDLLSAFQSWKRLEPPDLSQVQIVGYDEDNVPRIQGKLMDFLMAEIILNNQSHILMDRRWFRVGSSFNEHLNEIIERFLPSEPSYSLEHWPTNQNGPIIEDLYINNAVRRSKRLIKFHKDRIFIASGQAEMCDIYDTRDQRPRLVFIKRGVTSKSRELSRQAVDSVLLLLTENDFRHKAILKLREKGINLPDDFTFSACGVVLAVVDEKDRTNQPFVERLPIISKIEFAFALQTLNSRMEGPVYLYEIPKQYIEESHLDDKVS